MAHAARRDRIQCRHQLLRKGQQWITAMRLPWEMLQCLVKPNAIACSSTISSCENGQQWITATSLLQEMQRWLMQSDALKYNTTISSCEKGQQSLTAMSLLQEMQ